MENFEFKAENEGGRVDAWLTERLAEAFETGDTERTFSRSFIKKLIDGGSVWANGDVVKSSYKVETGDVVTCEIPEPETLDVLPEDIPLDIIHEDEDIIIINKPRGMVVHPAPGNYSGTLVNAVLFHCRDLSDINGVIRPGIVHRIDRDTTGLIAVAKNNQAHVALSDQLSDHTMARVYYAITEGTPKEGSGTIDAPIGRHPVDRKKMAINREHGKPAVTHYRVLSSANGFALVECRLETGRTHQIRVHMASIGHPIVGDPVYGIKNMRGAEGQLLHAGELSMIHPSQRERVTYRAKWPADFEDFAEKKGLLFEGII